MKAKSSTQHPGFVVSLKRPFHGNWVMKFTLESTGREAGSSQGARFKLVARRQQGAQCCYWKDHFGTLNSITLMLWRWQNIASVLFFNLNDITSLMQLEWCSLGRHRTSKNITHGSTVFELKKLLNSAAAILVRLSPFSNLEQEPFSGRFNPLPLSKTFFAVLSDCPAEEPNHRPP